MSSYVYPTSLAIRSAAAFARADKQWHDKSRPLSVPFHFAAVGFAPASGNRGSTKQLKSGVRLKRACYDRARTFIIFLPDPRKRPAKFPRHPCRTPWSTALREFSLFPSLSLFPSNQPGELSWKISLFLFSHSFARGDKSAQVLFQHATNRNWTFGEPNETCCPIHFVFRRIWE